MKTPMDNWRRQITLSCLIGIIASMWKSGSVPHATEVTLDDLFVDA